MPRPRIRFLLATCLMVSAALPAAAQSAPPLILDRTDLAGPALEDGYLGPGDMVDVTPVLRVGEPGFRGGNGTISVPEGSKLSEQAYFRPIPAAAAQATTAPTSPFVVKLDDDYTCGQPASVNLAIDGPDGHGDIPISFKTGLAGPLRSYVSTDVGGPIRDGESIDSDVFVTENGRVKAVRVNLDSVSEIHATGWYDLRIVSPAGTPVTLYSRTRAKVVKSFENVTFSDAAALSVDDPSVTQLRNVDVRPEERLSAFDGEPAAGTWRLEWRALSDDVSLRSGHGTGRAGTGGEVEQLGGWSLGVANAICSSRPIPSFSPDPLILSPAGGTLLDASASVDPGLNNAFTSDGAITSYQWDLDGVPGFEVTSEDPTTVSPPIPKGKRNITLRVTDNDDQFADKTVEALVTEAPTISAITVDPEAPEAGQPVTATATAVDPDGSIAKYEWDFDGDGAFELEGPSATTSYTWTRSGPQVARVRVTDDTGATAVSAVLVSVTNKLPVARLALSATPVIVGSSVTLDAGASTDIDGEIVAYEWDVDGAPGFEVTPDGAATLTHAFPEVGLRTVGVRVTDNNGQSDTEQLAVLVTAKPTAVIAASTTTPTPTQVVTFDGRASADPDPARAIVHYEWDLDGDNSFETTGSAVVTKAYPNVANVQVKLRVTSQTGARGESFLAVSVRNPAAGGGAVAPPPTPIPTPVPSPGGAGVIPTPGAGVVADVPGLTPRSVTPDLIVSDATTAFTATEAPAAIGVLRSGFQAKLTVAGKQKAKRALKSGIVVKVTVNAPGTIHVKGMVTAAVAKKLRLRPKGKAPLAVASGRLVIKKAGTFRLAVKVPKKYQRAVSRSKKTAMVLRAAVTEKETGDILAIGKKTTVAR